MFLGNINFEENETGTGSKITGDSKKALEMAGKILFKNKQNNDDDDDDDDEGYEGQETLRELLCLRTLQLGKRLSIYRLN